MASVMLAELLPTNRGRSLLVIMGFRKSGTVLGLDLDSGCLPRKVFGCFRLRRSASYSDDIKSFSISS
jgi:hypothetical protein